MSDLISIIMSTYNEKEEWVSKSIVSMLNQTYSNFEFIIILDNPENQELKKILYDYSEVDSRVRIVINQENLGLVRSLNIALGYCTGSYIARMDADDISHENRLQLQKEYLENEDVDLVFSRVIMINEDGKEMGQTNNQELSHSQVKEKLEAVNMSFHPTWLVKKEVYDKLDGYREIAYCEDYDFSLRALSYGYRIGKLNENLLFYRVRESSISRSYSLEQFINSRGLLKLYKKGQLDTASVFNSRVLKQVTPKEKEKFREADIDFFKGINFLKNNMKFKGVKMIVVSSLKSKYYFVKNMNYLHYKSKDLKISKNRK